LEAALNFAPGSSWEYCSPGFWVLAELVSRISGSHYTVHVEESVLAPLGMSDTRYETQLDPPDRYVDARAPTRSHLAEQVRRLAYPAGGLVGTVPDLLAFGRSFLTDGHGPQVLGPVTTKLLWRPWAHGWYQGRAVTWSLGWELGGPGTLRSDQSLFHYGGSGTALWIDPDERLVVALLTASWFLDWRIFGEVANGALGCVKRTNL
jgi:CubicO group peptidase (beta-lactamase class C family)